jgi:hypothetical protein
MPSARVRAVLDLVAELTDAERGELHMELDGAFAPSPADWERAWTDELSRRIARVENGEVSLIDGDEVPADLRADLAR